MASTIETGQPLSVLFAHDHRFIPAQGQIWSEQQFEAALWQRYLAQFDHVTVVARHGPLPAGKTIAVLEKSSTPGVDFELLPNLSSLRGVLRERPAAKAKMRDLVIEHDAVIARLPSEIGLMAIAAAQDVGKPWAVEIVGCPWDGMRHYGSLTGRLYAPLAMKRMQRAVAASEHAIYVTQHFLQNRYPSQARNIAGVSDVILETVDDSVLEQRLARIDTVGANPLRLGLIGTLRGRFKGIQTLFDALAAQKDTLPAWELHILGGGSPDPWQQVARDAGLAEHVFFDGTLPAGEAVFSWLDNIDIYLQPSLKEGLPRALVEAMSRACPAVASTVAGIPELLPPEDLMTPGNAKELADLLVRRASDQDWMRDRARRNWQEARSFRSDILAERRDGFWQQFAQTVQQSQRGASQPGAKEAAI